MVSTNKSSENSNIFNFFKRTSPTVIILCAIFLGVEVSFHQEEQMQYFFKYVDYLFLFYFTTEIVIRFIYNDLSFLSFVNKIRLLFKQKVKGNVIDTDIENTGLIEHWLWLLFDGLIVLMGIASLFSRFIDHPEWVAVLRLFRIFRILRIFEISPTLKSIEKKIISVVPTVFVFGLLLFMIIFVYAIIGMHLYNYQKFASIDFSSLYGSITGLFIMSTNGWSGAFEDLKTNASNVTPLITDFYVFSYVIFSVLVTLNVFIAVMTGHIQDKLQDDMKKIEVKEDVLLNKVDENLEKILNKFKKLENEINDMKIKIEDSKKR